MKLLICDDDISTIDVIESQLDCSALGIDTILRAYNGEAAKKIIEEEHPELILCDIGMPICNGIEVLKYIYENGIRTEFTFLTCYEDFEYAREAVRYNASNYLTKPLDLSELQDALQKMISAAKSAAQQSGSLSEPQSLVESRINHVLHQIHDGYYGTDQKRIDQVLQKSRITEFRADTLYRPVFLSGDMSDALQEGWSRELLTDSFARLAEEALTDHVGILSTVNNIGERYLYTTTFVDPDTATEAECMIRARQFERISSVNLSITPVCIVGEVIPLYKASEYARKLRSQMRKVLLQAGSIFTMQDVENITEGSTSFIEDIEVMRYINDKDRAGYIDMIASLLDRIVHSRRDNSRMMSVLHQELLHAFYSVLRDNSIPVRNLFQSVLIRSADQNSERSVAEMLNYAGMLYDFASQELSRANESSDLLSTVKRYIQTHYKEDIDRDTIAAVAFITPNYLSKKFHAETGMSLREYINQLRIDEAKRLLLSTNATVSEVASQVGYDNISYFSTVFRKMCGMSPIEWCGRKGELKDKES